MGRIFTLTLLSLLMLVLVGCGDKNSGTPTNCSGDTSYLLNNSCKRLHWDSLPITLTFNDNVPQNVRILTMQAAAEWESAAGKPLFIFDELQGRSPENLNLITITADNQWDGEENENAKTFYLYEGESLRQAIISIRDRVIQNKNIDTFSVVLHELGHSIGLGHDETNVDSIMYPQLGEYEAVRVLAPVDIERVRTI